MLNSINLHRFYNWLLKLPSGLYNMNMDTLYSFYPIDTIHKDAWFSEYIKFMTKIKYFR